MAVLRWVTLCVVFGALIPLTSLSAERKGLSEQELRAAALYQVLHFTRWPAGTFQSTDQPLVVGIFGEDPFGSLIDELVAGETASGHPIRVVRVFTAEALAQCHVVFVSSKDERAVARVLFLVRDRPVLTVGDAESFCEQGGILALPARNNRIRIVVNLDEAKDANVTLSSKLLRLAQIVKR
jgi:hypothetical protein